MTALILLTQVVFPGALLAWLTFLPAGSLSGVLLQAGRIGAFLSALDRLAQKTVLSASRTFDSKKLLREARVAGLVKLQCSIGLAPTGSFGPRATGRTRRAESYPTALRHCDRSIQQKWPVAVLASTGQNAQHTRFANSRTVVVLEDVTGPSLPEGPTVVPSGAQDFVSDPEQPSSLPSTDERSWGSDGGNGVTLDDGGVAAARVVSSVCGHNPDFFTPGGLVQHSGRTGPSPSRLRVNSTARTSDVAG